MNVTLLSNAAVWHLAQVNVAVLRAPLDDPSMAGFTLAFDPVAQLAEESPGFVWRLATGSGHAVVPGEDGVDQVVNVSVWQTYQGMHEFVYHTLHGRLLLRRQRWFLPTRQPSTALWWVAEGTRPTVDEALARLRYLRTYGPSPRAFSLIRQFSATGRAVGSSRGSAHGRRQRGGLGGAGGNH